MKKGLMFLSCIALVVGTAFSTEEKKHEKKHTHKKTTHAPKAKESAIKHIKTREEFQKTFAPAQPSGKPVVIKFYADWCGACQHMAKSFEAVAERNKADADFVAISVDNPELKDVVASYGVQLLPTIVFKQVGALPEAEIEKRVHALTGKKPAAQQEVKHAPAHEKHHEKKHTAKKAA